MDVVSHTKIGDMIGQRRSYTYTARILTLNSVAGIKAKMPADVHFLNETVSLCFRRAIYHRKSYVKYRWRNLQKRNDKFRIFHKWIEEKRFKNMASGSQQQDSGNTRDWEWWTKRTEPNKRHLVNTEVAWNFHFTTLLSASRERHRNQYSDLGFQCSVLDMGKPYQRHGPRSCDWGWLRIECWVADVSKRFEQRGQPCRF